MENRQHISYLLERYLEGLATPPERSELWQELAKNKDDAAWQSLLEELALLQPKDTSFDKGAWEDIINTILHTTQHRRTEVVHRVHFLRRSWLRYAAAIILLVGMVVLYRANHSGKADKPVAQKTIITPGNNKAILTLADGKKITLDDKTNGRPVQAGGIEISTPRGGQYHLVLPDGTHIWLNAASSVKFPAAFTGVIRNVSINGEAYLEIAKNKEKPFILTAANTRVEVLGTTFNINAYADEESIKTTLLEGSIKIIAGHSPTAGAGVLGVNTNTFKQPPSAQPTRADEVILQPGQQAQSSGEEIAVLKEADTETITAWKNGRFRFTDASIQAIMKNISRWYDIDIVYEGTIEGNFVADISRNVELSELLHILELTNRVHFIREGRKIIVKP